MCRSMLCKKTEDKADVALPTQVDLVPSSSRDSSWGISPTIAAALHGGFSTPVFFHGEPRLPRTLPHHFQHPTPPSPNHVGRLRQCIHKGWHTCHFDAWVLNYQLNAGVPFLPQDERSNIGKHTTVAYVHAFSLTQAFGTMELQKSTPS